MKFGISVTYFASTSFCNSFFKCFTVKSMVSNSMAVISTGTVCLKGFPEHRAIPIMLITDLAIRKTGAVRNFFLRSFRFWRLCFCFILRSFYRYSQCHFCFRHGYFIDIIFIIGNGKFPRSNICFHSINFVAICWNYIKSNF